MTGMRPAFRERLRIAMRADPRTQAEIAKKAGYGASHIRRVLSGERPNPTLQFVEVMAGTLGCEPAWLLGFDK